MALNIQGGFPTVDSPVVTPGGTFTQPWYQFMINLWNRTGGSTGSTSAILDVIGSAQGDILYRGPINWQALAPGPAGEFLQTSGPGSNPIWAIGSVSAIANNRVIANLSGGVASPVANTVTAVLDVIGAVQGDIMYRDAAAWAALAPGSAGQFLQAQGAAANPSWQWPESVTTAIAAAGINQATATALTTTVSEVTTVGLNSGVRLPAASAGQRYFVINDQAVNALLIYPNGAAQIDALGASAAYSLPASKRQLFWVTSAVQIYSTQLG